MKLNLTALPAKLEINPFGDRAIVLSYSGETGPGSWHAMAMAASGIRRAKKDWIVDIVPAYETVTIVYNPVRVLRAWQEDHRAGGDFHNRAAGRGSDVYKPRMPFEAAVSLVEAILKSALQGDPDNGQNTIEVPVYYGDEFGPDLEACAARSGMNAADFSAMHASGEYTVALIGFMPGFPYMAGLKGELAQPRREDPRARVPAGSVGIAGLQTGIYPLDSPGGWQIIGRTPLRLFQPDRPKPALFRAGDRVRFIAVNEAEFRKRQEEEGRECR